MNTDAVRSLLAAIAEKDLSVIPILADALSEAGDERAEMVRNYASQKNWYFLSGILFAFPELQDEALFVKGWDKIKKRLREAFKERIIRLGMRYCYNGKNNGTLVISYASPDQLEWVKRARLTKLDEWPKNKPLFETEAACQ